MPPGARGSRSSASRIVDENFAGSAVSMQISGKSGRRSARPTFKPSAVCGSIVTP